MFSTSVKTVLDLSTTKFTVAQRRQEGTDIVTTIFLGNTLHLRRSGRADRSRARSRRRALGSRGALHFRASRTRAWRAFTCIFLAGTIVNDNRLLLRNAALKHILAEIRSGGALSLQHILTHIGALRARRNSALQHILAQIRFAAGRAHRTGVVSTRARTCLLASRADGNT